MKTNRVRHFLLTYFTYTRAEKHAALFLTLLLLILQTALWIRYYQVDNSAALPAEIPPAFKKETSVNKISVEHETPHSDLHYFFFDPDTAGVATLQQLGLSVRQAESMIRYREKTKGFHSAEDVRKVKVLRDELYKQWEPWMRFSNTKAGEQREQLKSVNTVQHDKTIEINSADTVKLMELPFIGAGRAKAIVNYRNRLGGFIRKEQLQEIKIIPDSVYQIIRGKISCDGLVFRRMDINHAPLDSLKHPYLSRSLARIIVNYREQHGPFLVVQDLEKLPLVEAEILTKLAPYLKINP